MSLNLYQRQRTFEPMMNNTYEDEHGNTAYTVHTPFAFSPHRTTTISRAIHDIQGSGPSSTPVLARRITITGNEQRLSFTDSHTEGQTLDDDPESLDVHPRNSHIATAPSYHSSSIPATMTRRRTADHNFIYVAQIDWKIFRSTRIRFGTGSRSGREILVKDLFNKEGWGFWGRHRVFTGDDGKAYRWNFGRTHPQLVLNDHPDTLIATFHQERLFAKQNKAYLEIFPLGQHMVDEIFVTFIYVERLRKAKERSVRN
ncbi:hypothetical protein EV361DRAFT_802554 [Lentinula raphanica]|uniref:DUF6593 domain-containing protein n=1 Tax=Lentinula raphanica TaxID=153919 RepID=A0AA38UD00_9AGAR|nr:hypothetical protein F5878DRAFT_622116 [Lentinula raphanica]KAJ3970161.1 hypothetical protein EV361DRAFT_802554 [Lentinula raphanica]